MTNAPIPIPEARIREILTDFLAKQAFREFPEFVNVRIPKDDHCDTTHTLSVIPAPTASPGTIILAAHEVTDPSVEVARFAVRVDVRKIPVPGAPPAAPRTPGPVMNGRPLETVDVLDTEPTPVTIIWTEGTWGPREIASGGHSYDFTPVPGDTIRTPAGSEWAVVVGLTLSNRETVTVVSLDGAKTLQQTPPQGWSHPVTFRRGPSRRGVVRELLAVHLGAVEIDSNAKGGAA